MAEHTGGLNSQKIKVLVLDNSNGVTGAFKSIFALTRQLESTYEFHYGVPTRSKLVELLTNQGKKVTRIPFLELQRNYKIVLYLPCLLLNTLRILRLVRQHDIQIVHVNDLYNMCGVMVKFLRRDVNVVYHVRLMDTSYVNALYKFFARVISRYANAVIAVSESVKNALSKLDVHAVVVYDSLAEEKYPLRVKKNESDPITLLYLANFIEGKGHRYALQAFEVAQKQIPNLKMIMAGGDLGLQKNILMKNELVKSAQVAGLSNQITFYDYVEDAEKLMKESDIVLNFSESESFSLTCLEALTYGVPLIASDSGGPKELFENEISGLLVPNRDVTAMANAIVRLSENKTLRKSFAEKGKHFVSEKFNLQKCARALSSVYVQFNQ